VQRLALMRRIRLGMAVFDWLVGLARHSPHSHERSEYLTASRTITPLLEHSAAAIVTCFCDSDCRALWAVGTLIFRPFTIV
jgi:hypothetical protein